MRNGSLGVMPARVLSLRWDRDFVSSTWGGGTVLKHLPRHGTGLGQEGGLGG